MLDWYINVVIRLLVKVKAVCMQPHLSLYRSTQFLDPSLDRVRITFSPAASHRVSYCHYWLVYVHMSDISSLTSSSQEHRMVFSSRSEEEVEVIYLIRLCQCCCSLLRSHYSLVYYRPSLTVPDFLLDHASFKYVRMSVPGFRSGLFERISKSRRVATNNQFSLLVINYCID